MPIDPSMEPMLDTFIYETTTLLDQLDQILLDSEKSKSFSSDSVNEVFRIMHTIKGSAAMMDLGGISSLAHAVEDVFYILREDPTRLSLGGEALFDVVFQASDFLKSEVDSVQNTGDATQDPSAMIQELERLSAVLQGKASVDQIEPPAAAAPAEPAAPVPEAKPGMHRVRVHFEEGCQMENIRAFMLMEQLKDLCDSLESVPAHPENDASLCSEIAKNGFVILFHPVGGVEDVLQVIENSLNIQSYELLEDEAPAAAAAPAAPAQPAPAPQAAKPDAPAAPASAAGKSASGSGSANGASRAKQSLISVNQAKLDQLMDLVGELVTTESMVVSNPDLKGLHLDNFNKSARELRKLTDELQDVVMSMRMVPLSGVFQKMNRIVRDMSKKLGKQVRLTLIGEDTEVDKTIVDSISDPIMHIVRNSMDHGIEENVQDRIDAGKDPVGEIILSARHTGSEVIIEVKDDGQGVNYDGVLSKAIRNGIASPEVEYSHKDILNFLMAPGFSTNTEVTEYSGRGVGMDVVKRNVEDVGGTVSITSEPGQGMTTTLKIPLTMAIMDGMEVSVGSSIFTIPIHNIRQSFKVSGADLIHDASGGELFKCMGNYYPVVRMYDRYHIQGGRTEISDGILIWLESGELSYCLFVDELLGEQQVVVKPLPSYLNRFSIKQSGIAGCTILGDGNISIILDVANLYVPA